MRLSCSKLLVILQIGHRFNLGTYTPRVSPTKQKKTVPELL